MPGDDELVLGAALARAAVPEDRVAAVGLSTQGGTFAVFDPRGVPRGPALVWSDARLRRPEPDSPALRAEHFRLTGVSHRAMTPANLSWIKAHRPGWLAPPCRVGFVPDYLIFRLTGEWVSDPTNLSISNLLALADGDIALPVLDRLRVPREAFAHTRRVRFAARQRALGLRGSARCSAQTGAAARC